MPDGLETKSDLFGSAFNAPAGQDVRSMFNLSAAEQAAPSIAPPPLIDDDESPSNLFVDMLLLPEIAFFDRSVRGAIYAGIKGEGLTGIMERFLKGSPLAHLSDAIFDTDFSENVTGEMVLKAAGVDSPGILSSIMFEIATGPSTFAGFGAVTKLGNAAKMGKFFKAAIGAEEAADGLRVIERYGQKMAVGTAEELGARGLKSGGVFKLADMTLGEQAEAGFRTLAQIRIPKTDWALPFFPKAINVPVLNGFEWAMGWMSRSAVGQGARQLFSVMPVVGKAASAENRAASGVLGDMIAKTEHAAQGMNAALNHEIDVGVNAVMSGLSPELRPLVSKLQEIGGLQNADAVLTSESVMSAFDTRLTEVLGGSSADARSAFRDTLAAQLDHAHTADDAIETATQMVEALFSERGLRSSSGAQEKVLALPKGFLESMSKAKASREAIGESLEEGAEVLTKDERKYAKLREGLTKKINANYEKADAVIRKLGLGGPFDVLSSPEAFDDALLAHAKATGADLAKLRTQTAPVARFFRQIERMGGDGEAILASLAEGTVGDVGETMVARFEQTVSDYASLSPEVQAALHHGPQGYRTLVERVGALISDRGSSAALVEKFGSDFIDPKTRAGLQKAADRAQKAFAGAGPEDFTALRTKILPAAAAAERQSDLLKAAILGVDETNTMLRTIENATGLAVSFSENYFAHVPTKEGAALINSLGREALGRSETAQALFRKERELVGWTVGEVNAVARETGFKATGDTPGKILTELDDHVMGMFKGVDPNTIKKLRAVDPQAAGFFEGNAIMALKRRASASARAMSRAEMVRDFTAPLEKGGFGIRTWDIAEDALPETIAAIRNQVARHMEGKQASEVLIRADDFLNPSTLRPREVIRESQLMDVFGVGDSRQALRANVEALEETSRKFAGVPEFRPSVDKLEPGTRLVSVDRQVWDEMNRVHGILTSPMQAGKLETFLNKATTFFRGWWTLPAPGFHFRNIAGDVTNAFVGGMSDPTHFVTAMQIQKAAAGLGSKALKDIKIGNMDGLEAWQTMKKFGVVGSDFIAGDMFARAEVRAAGAGGVPDWVAFWDPRRFTLLKPAAKLAEYTSDITRAGFFLDQIVKGIEPIQAAAASKKYMVDYTGTLFTPFERRAARLAIPFYSYMRRATPLVMEGLVTNPGPLTVIGKAAAAVRSGAAPADSLPDSLIPDYVKESYGIPVRFSKDGNPEYFLLKNWIPGGDLAELADGIGAIAGSNERNKATLLHSFVQRVSPIIKLPLELVANFSTFTWKPIETPERQYQEVFGVPFSAKQAYILRSIRVLNDIDKLNIAGVERSGEQGQRGEADTSTRLTSWLTGFRTYSPNVAEQKSRSEYQIERELSTLTSALRRTARNVQAPKRETQMEDLKRQIREKYKDLYNSNARFADFREKMAEMNKK